MSGKSNLGCEGAGNEICCFASAKVAMVRSTIIARTTDGEWSLAACECCADAWKQRCPWRLRMTTTSRFLAPSAVESKRETDGSVRRTK